MAKIGVDFPQTRAARKSLIEELKKHSEPCGSVKIPGRGRTEVYRIPLKYLSYNPYNTRFLAQAKTLESRKGRVLSDENAEDISEIEKFLWDYKSDNNETTIKSLIRDGQLQPGVVTADGIILSGNRRFCLLNEISRNHDKYSKYGSLDGLEYFEAAIIFDVLSDKEIRRFESIYQYGSDEKVDYEPIQKYIGAHEQKVLEFTEKEIAENFMSLTNGDPKIVEKWLRVYTLMEEYLSYIGEPDIYTALTSKEEAFLNLEQTIKSFKTGKAGKEIWSFDSMDLEDLKCRYFDFIRLGIATHDFRLFKTIFSDQERWANFNNDVTNAVIENPIDDFEEYRKNHHDKSDDAISQIRKNDYEQKVKTALNGVYGRENAFFTSKKLDEAPVNVANQALDKLSKLQDMLQTKKTSENELNNVYEVILQIKKKVFDIEKKL